MELENTKFEFKKLKKEYDFENECGNCKSNELLQIHHIVPLALGGTNNRGNLCVLCKDCHEKAHGGTTLVDFNSSIKQQNRGGGKIPFGYRKSKGKLVRAYGYKLVRSIIELRIIHKMTSGTIVKALNDLNIDSPGGSKWTHHQIMYRLIENEKYFKGINIAEPIMNESLVTWDMVVEHKNKTIGQKRMEYNNKDIEKAKNIIKNSQF